MDCSQTVMLPRQKHIGATGYIHAGSVVERIYDHRPWSLRITLTSARTAPTTLSSK